MTYCVTVKVPCAVPQKTPEHVFDELKRVNSKLPYSWSSHGWSFDKENNSVSKAYVQYEVKDIKDAEKIRIFWRSSNHFENIEIYDSTTEFPVIHGEEVPCE